jgi:membrane protein
MSAHKFFWLLRRAGLAVFYDNCFEIAKSAAYSSILSFFPGLMVVTSLLFREDVSDVVDEISIALGRVLPPGVYRVAEQYITTHGARTYGLLAGAWFVAIWSASNVMASLIAGFGVAYRVPVSRSLVKNRLVALALLPIAGLPMLVATIVILFGQQIENWLIAHLGESSWWVAPAGQAMRWSVALLTSVLVIGLLYHAGPNRRQKWRMVWPGAGLATCLWLAATLLFAWYVRHVARYSALYGSISTAVVLLIWMYIVNLVVLFGCEFNAEYERAHAAAAKHHELARL